MHLIVLTQIIEEEGLQENCKEVGDYCLRELSKMRDEYDIIGDVRGKGLLIGIELVADKKVCTPLYHVSNCECFVWEQ